MRLRRRLQHLKWEVRLLRQDIFVNFCLFLAIVCRSGTVCWPRCFSITNIYKLFIQTYIIDLRVGRNIWRENKWLCCTRWVLLDQSADRSGRGQIFSVVKRDSVTRFSTLGFFHQTIPPRALIHGLKPLCIWLRIRRENRFENRQNRISRSQWDRGHRHFLSEFPFNISSVLRAPR
jgi:hypothetical protein